MSLDDLDRVVRERLIGSPPHTLQYLGTLERVNYIGKIGTISRMGTIAKIGTVLLMVHIGTVHKVDRIGTLDEVGKLGTVSYLRRLGTQQYLGRVGTISYVDRMGTVGNIRRIGSLDEVGKIGTVSYVKRLGTQPYLGRLGTIGYQNRLGTLGFIKRIGTCHVGTVPVNIAAQDIMLGVDVQARYYSPIAIRGRVHLGQGSTWIGSWQDVSKFQTKTFSILGRGSPGIGAGSFAIITGMIGTGAEGYTGTYYGPVNIGAGSLVTKSFTEAVGYVRPYFKKSGTYSGTVSVVLGRQV